MKLAKFFSMFLCVVTISQLFAHTHNGEVCYQSRLAKLESVARKNPVLKERMEDVRQACVLKGHDVEDKVACDYAMKLFRAAFKAL